MITSQTLTLPMQRNFVSLAKNCRQPLNHSGRFTSDDLEKASVFNEYFNLVLYF